MYENNSLAGSIRKTPTNKHPPSQQNFIDQKNPLNYNHRRRNSQDTRENRVNQANSNSNTNANSNQMQQSTDIRSIITQVERPNSKTTSAKNKETIR